MFEPRGYGNIHFHDYGNTWFLDVASELMHIISIHPCNLDFLRKFGHYEFDEIAEENRDKTDPSDLPCLFALEIDSVLNTSLCPLSEIEKEGKVKVCRTIK